MNFQKEAITPECFKEFSGLFHKHWKEIAHYQDIILDPDEDFYLKADQLGLSRLFTIRNEEKVLVGYAVFFVKKNGHYKASLQASQDILFLDPTLRGSLIGYRFIKWCDEQLAAEGVQVVYQHVKVSHDFGSMLERLGYQFIDKIYGKRLD